MLRADGLRKSFGGPPVVRDCSLEVREGEIVGLIGPNGAGKTTVFNLLTSIAPPDAGVVTFRREAITGWATERIAQAGLVRTFQVPLLFDGLSVIENLLVAAPHQSRENLWRVWLTQARVAREEAEVEARAWDVLGFLGMTSVANNLGSQLSGGQKKLLELGRALMVRPALVLLDEPVAGITARLAIEIAERLRQLRADGFTFLLIEHKMDFLMSLADRVYVMAAGSVLAEGTPEEVRANPAVLETYLGTA